MHVLILSQYYTPEPIPKPAALAQGLLELGHTPVVITGFPNYPSGKMYDGYSLRLLQHEMIDGVSVSRTFEYPNHGKHVLWRFINYISFMISAPFASFRARKCSVIYVWHPPLTIGISAWIISRLLKVPVVYDVQDIWPETIAASGIMSSNSKIYSFLKYVERFVYKKMHRLIVVTEGAKRNLISKGVAEEKIMVLPHWVDETQFQNLTTEERNSIRQEFNWASNFIILFAGNLGFVQGLDTVIYAASYLPLDTSIRIVFMGGGSAEVDLRRLAKALNVEPIIQFIPFQPMDRMPLIMGGADVLLVHLRKSVITDFVVPSKTLSYLAAGRPILMAMGGAGHELITESGAGISIEPDQTEMLAEIMLQLAEMSSTELDRFGENGKRFLSDNLNRTRVLQQYIDLLESVGHANDKPKH